MVQLFSVGLPLAYIAAVCSNAQSPSDEASCSSHPRADSASMLQVGVDSASMLQVGVGGNKATVTQVVHSSRLTQGVGRSLSYIPNDADSTKQLKRATAVTWTLGLDGAFKASQPIGAEATFSQKPDSDVGCRSCDCSFIAQDGFASPCDIEGNSRAAIALWLPGNASVLEVGARYGSTSCAIAAKQNQSGKVVSMDADQSVWESLDKNRVSHGCNFKIARGLLGKTDGVILQNHFGTMAGPLDAMATKTGLNETVRVPHFTVDDLQREHNLQFDAAAFDCEGCFAFVMTDFPEFASQLKTLIVECHNPDEDAAVKKLQTEGWKLLAHFSRQHVLQRE